MEGLDEALLLPGENAEADEQPKPGLQGAHLDLSNRSTEDPPAWYCLIPLAKADGELSKASRLLSD